MDFREVVAKRRMVRNYTGEPVDSDVLDRIIDTGLRAPSAGFSQGQRFIVVTDKDRRSDIAIAAGEDEYVADGFAPWISRAPVHIVLCADQRSYVERYSEPDKASTPEADEWPVPYWWVDAGASMMLLLLAAVDEGLAAGFLGAHAMEPVRRALNIPDDIHVVGIVTIGHAADDRRSGSLKRGWRDRGDVVFENYWSD